MMQSSFHFECESSEPLLFHDLCTGGNPSNTLLFSSLRKMGPAAWIWLVVACILVVAAQSQDHVLRFLSQEDIARMAKETDKQTDDIIVSNGDYKGQPLEKVKAFSHQSTQCQIHHWFGTYVYDLMLRCPVWYSQTSHQLLILYSILKPHTKHWFCKDLDPTPHPHSKRKEKKKRQR